MTMLQQANALADQLVAWRREIHMQPELGFEEERTSRLVAESLREMGIEAEVGVAETGVVARIGEGRPAVGIRADMDALPIQEANEVPYKSRQPGLMHACGHDAHTSMLLGVASLLNDLPDRPAGEIRLLFQPSEEKWREKDGHSGGSLMVEEKALDGLDAVIACHVASGRPMGEVRVADGVSMAAPDVFEAKIIGEGTHGATPNHGLDPIWLQAQVVNALQAIRSRRRDPTERSVVSVGTIHAGVADNVIPNEVFMTGTIRTFEQEAREEIHRLVEEAFALVRHFGGDYELRIRTGYPPLYNDPAVAELIRSAAADLLGEDQAGHGEPIMAGEDFAYMTQKAPGAMLRLGAQLDEVNRPHHSPIFDIHEGCLPVGVGVMAESALRLLKKHGG
ncbi:MAG: M20 family metallopeptidase [Chloroflexota bacterium]|nr:M20 family metallopeptidase [Chloroflexota bacterium]